MTLPAISHCRQYDRIGSALSHIRTAARRADGPQRTSIILSTVWQEQRLFHMRAEAWSRVDPSVITGWPYGAGLVIIENATASAYVHDPDLA